MAWIKWNPNPMGKHVGDCTIRAITKSLDKSWEDAYCGIALYGFIMRDMPSNNGVWGAYLKRQGFVRRMLPNDCPDCYTVEDFCQEHPKGTFVVATHGHVLAVIDGNYYDSWDSGQETPIYYFEREEE